MGCKAVCRGQAKAGQICDIWQLGLWKDVSWAIIWCRLALRLELMMRRLLWWRVNIRLSHFLKIYVHVQCMDENRGHTSLFWSHGHSYNTKHLATRPVRLCRYLGQSKDSTVLWQNAQQVCFSRWWTMSQCWRLLRSAPQELQRSLLWWWAWREGTCSIAQTFTFFLLGQLLSLQFRSTSPSRLHFLMIGCICSLP